MENNLEPLEIFHKKTYLSIVRFSAFRRDNTSKMSENTSGRDYDLVLIGATGYTGALTAEHIAEHLPTNLRWAIAGRSSTKLNGLAARLKELGPDRIQPGKLPSVN